MAEAERLSAYGCDAVGCLVPSRSPDPSPTPVPLWHVSMDKSLDAQTQACVGHPC